MFSPTLFLITAFWMLVEGLTLVTKTYGTAMRYQMPRQRKAIQFSIGWGIPFVIVALSTTIGFATTISYMDNGTVPGNAIRQKVTARPYTQCWLSTTSGMLVGAVMVPIGFTIVLNLLILARVAFCVYKKSAELENLKPSVERSESKLGLMGYDLAHTTVALKAVVVLIPVLGLPWILHYLAGEV